MLYLHTYMLVSGMVNFVHMSNLKYNVNCAVVYESL